MNAWRILKTADATMWTRSLISACVLELPLLVALAVYSPQNLQTELARVLVWYHVIPLSVLSFGILWLFGHGAAEGPAVAPALGHVFYWTATFAIQVAVTTPLIFLILRSIMQSPKDETTRKQPQTN
jgi:hypothetical protein